MVDLVNADVSLKCFVVPQRENGIGLRVVHISDTHSRHWEYVPIIPEGDILIHSGDFAHIATDEEYYAYLKDFNAFLGALPHRYKVYVSGNHEERVAFHPIEETQAILTNTIYLQDSSVCIEGISIYGTPWSNFNCGFSCSRDHLPEIWRKIPSGIDILVTHLPPFNILDRAWEGPGRGPSGLCSHCNAKHPTSNHWGCNALSMEVRHRIRPRYHLFGHNHDEPGFLELDGIYFCNAAMDIYKKPIVFDISVLIEPQTHETKLAVPLVWTWECGFLVHSRTGMVLDIDLADPSEGARVHVWTKLHPTRPQQQWNLNGTTMQSRLSDLVLHCDGSSVSMTKFDNSKAQQWHYHAATGEFCNGLGRILDVKDGTLVVLSDGLS